jgi:hypothetical protein
VLLKWSRVISCMRRRSIYSPYSKNQPLGRFCAARGQTAKEVMAKNSKKKLTGGVGG